MKWYAGAPARLANGEVDWDSHTLVWTLHSSGYVPNKDTHAVVSDLTNELPSGSGYTPGTASGGGLALGSPARTYTPADSWGTQRANSTVYVVDDVFRPAAANGLIYRVVVAGTSAGSPPTFPTAIGATATDGTATIACVGRGITVLACDNPTWTAPFSAGPARIAVLSDRSSGNNATNPLIGYVDFAADKSGSAGTFTIILHPTLRALHMFSV